MIVYCPACEAACSEKADVCPKCGHPLAAPVDEKIISLVTLRTTKPYVIAIVVLGVLSLAAYTYVNAPRAPLPVRSQSTGSTLTRSSAPSLGTLKVIRDKLQQDQNWQFDSEYDALRGRRKWVFSHQDGYVCTATGSAERIDGMKIRAVINPNDTQERIFLGLFSPVWMIAKTATVDYDEISNLTLPVVRALIRHKNTATDERILADGRQLRVFAEVQNGFLELTIGVYCDPSD